MRFEATVDVMPKSEISDPQGLTVERALPTLGFEGIQEVRVGKHIAFTVEAATAEEARHVVVEAAKRFLANTVIEDFEVTIRPTTKAMEGTG